MVITGTASRQGAMAADMFAADEALVEGRDVRPRAGRATVDFTDESAVSSRLHEVDARHCSVDVLYAALASRSPLNRPTIARVLTQRASG